MKWLAARPVEAAASAEIATAIPAATWKTLRVSHSSHRPDGDDDRLIQPSTESGEDHLRTVAPHLERAFGTIFVNPPRKDECFCTFERLFIEKNPSDAYPYLLREIERFVREPPPGADGRLAQTLDCIQAMTMALDIMNEAVARSFRQLVETTGASPSYVM